MELKQTKKEPERSKSQDRVGCHTDGLAKDDREEIRTSPSKMERKHKGDMIYFQCNHPLSKLNRFIYINL